MRDSMVKDMMCMAPTSELIKELEKVTWDDGSMMLTGSEIWAELKRRLSGAPDTPVDMMYEMVHRFNTEIIGISPPKKPRILNFGRGEFRLGHLREELTEIEKALGEDDLEGTVDGLIDLAYVALGGVVEMGVPPFAAFQEVHERNMQKKQGTRAKRPNNGGKDAIKPDGWTPPDLRPYLSATRQEILSLYRSSEQSPVKVTIKLKATSDVKVPKILVIGYGRHGKDTVCEALRDTYGLTFTSSSMFCAEKVIMPFCKNAAKVPYPFRGIDVPGPLAPGPYDTVEECFEDRHNHREFWYRAIRDFNQPDAAALGRAIAVEHDVYCGLRSYEELAACREAGIFDHVIWVDRSRHLPPEDQSSCTVEPWMADHILDNNGSLKDLLGNLHELMVGKIYK